MSKVLIERAMLERLIHLEMHYGNRDTHTAAISALVSPQAPIPYSGADETPPVFARRWKIAEDGFGLQRDDQNGRYVDIEDALSVLHATLAEQPQHEGLEAAGSGTPLLGTPKTDLTQKTNMELAEAAGYNRNMWNILGPSLEPLIVLAEQRTTQRLQAPDGNAETGSEDAAVVNWKKANHAISLLNKSLATERDVLQAKLDKLQAQKPLGHVLAYNYDSKGATATITIENNLLNAGTEKMHQGLWVYTAPGGTSQLLEALRTAHDHLDMEALEISHCKDAAAIRAALTTPVSAEEAALAAEVQRLDNANKSLHEYTVQVNDECDKLQARIAELESQQVPEWFQEQVLKVQAERDALQAETLEVKGYWKAAAAKNRQLLTELADLQLRLDGQGKGDAQ